MSVVAVSAAAYLNRSTPTKLFSSVTYLNVPFESRVTVPLDTLSTREADNVSPSMSVSLLKTPSESTTIIRLSPDSRIYSSSNARGASFTGATIMTTLTLSVTFVSSFATYVKLSFP